jgi:hypothetical protein
LRFHHKLAKEDDMRTGIMVGLMVGLCVGAADAVDYTFELGPFGEVTTWLVAHTTPSLTLEQDPFEAAGGEATFAAMGDPAQAPFAGRTIPIPGLKTNEAIKVGDVEYRNGAWEVVKMTPPDGASFWNNYPRLDVQGETLYAYCQLISPEDTAGNLLLGTTGRCRPYLNGKDLGVIEKCAEDTSELPVQLKKGLNHLLVRIEQPARLSLRLAGIHSEPLRTIEVRIPAPYPLPYTPPPPAPVDPRMVLTKRAEEVGPISPAEHPEFLGAKIQKTMALLESGKYTHRPVRIVFSGQSIEGEWTDLLIQRLRERYPDTKIIWENRAIGGWFVWRMQKLFKHEILRWQPDLVLFSAYQGSSEVWERILRDLRSETTADIVFRTGHLAGKGVTPNDPPDDAETIMLRRLAQKYDVELVELRTEWMDYLKKNKLLDIKELMRDGIHLNSKGNALMALLYERHFVYNAASKVGWAPSVQRFDVGRFLEDKKTDEIVLTGPGWQRSHRGYAQSSSSQDALKLKFHGTRVDLVLPPGYGGASIKIDGKKPSELNLFHGTIPKKHLNLAPKDWALNPPMSYHTGKNMQEETWVLTVTEANDAKAAHVKFNLKGSKTGFDGEGTNDKHFVSNSGRITILTTDWSNEVRAPKEGETLSAMKALEQPYGFVWHILPDSMDTVFCRTERDAKHGGMIIPDFPKQVDWCGGMPYDYVTIADGLPCAVHELTLTPVEMPGPNNQFIISGIEVHRPPLARDVSEWTVP